MKTQTIEVDDSTASVLKQRAAERGVTVPELVAELATIAVSPVAADVDEIAELDRRWKAFEAQDSVASNDESSDGFKHGAHPRFGAGRIDEAGVVGRCTCRH